MKITSYLMFNGQAEAAANFYAEVFGGRIENMHRYADFPPVEGQPPVPEEYKQRVGHCCVDFPGGTMGIADTALPDQLVFGTGLMLTICVDSVAEAEAVWPKISADAQKIMCPLQKTFYAERYGELVDKFGVQWAVMCCE